jgi:hypothetical protein
MEFALSTSLPPLRRQMSAGISPFRWPEVGETNEPKNFETVGIFETSSTVPQD